MNRLLALCFPPYLFLSWGLFEQQDKYSLSPWQIFHLCRDVTFIRTADPAWEKRYVTEWEYSNFVLTRTNLKVDMFEAVSKPWASSCQLVQLARVPCQHDLVPFPCLACFSFLLVLYVLCLCTLSGAVLGILQQANPLRTQSLLCAKCSLAHHVKNPICLFTWAKVRRVRRDRTRILSKRSCSMTCLKIWLAGESLKVKSLIKGHFPISHQACGYKY